MHLMHALCCDESDLVLAIAALLVRLWTCLPGDTGGPVVPSRPGLGQRARSQHVLGPRKRTRKHHTRPKSRKS